MRPELISRGASSIGTRPHNPRRSTQTQFARTTWAPATTEASAQREHEQPPQELHLGRVWVATPAVALWRPHPERARGSGPPHGRRVTSMVGAAVREATRRLRGRRSARTRPDFRERAYLIAS